MCAELSTSNMKWQEMKIFYLTADIRTESRVPAEGEATRRNCRGSWRLWSSLRSTAQHPTGTDASSDCLPEHTKHIQGKTEMDKQTCLHGNNDTKDTHKKTRIRDNKAA